MPGSDVEVAVVGGGGAGVAAARRLHGAGVDCLIVEARERLGGRAYTFIDPAGYAIDLGCGWLHSADRNPWSDVAASQHRQIDHTPPPWMRAALPLRFSLGEQQEYRKASHAFYERLEASEADPDLPAARLLEPGGRWNNLIVTINTFVTGAELEQVSAHDMARYADSGVNWRVVEGYGTLIAAHGAGVPAAFDCPVRRIDHSATRLRIETAKGTIRADQAIVTLPTPMLERPELFLPRLPDKADAAASLPLGLDDKLFVSLEHAEEFEAETRVFGRTDRVGAGAYHLRPFGRPQIECYFGGSLAAQLEGGGQAAFFDFAAAELSDVLGSGFAKRIKPIAVHGWRADPFARGSYSYARPGKADMRAVLAAPVDQRLFFAGEACSRHDYSTAHGGYLTGFAAADAVLAVRQRRRG